MKQDLQTPAKLAIELLPKTNHLTSPPIGLPGSPPPPPPSSHPPGPPGYPSHCASPPTNFYG